MSAMAGRIDWANIVINSPVREIDQDPHGATVISESVTVRVRKVIVAFASTIQGFIRFQPILPANRAQLQQRYPLGIIWKNWLVYDEAFWRTHIHPSNGKQFAGQTTSTHQDDFYAATLDAGPAPEITSPACWSTLLTRTKDRIRPDEPRPAETAIHRRTGAPLRHHRPRQPNTPTVAADPLPSRHAKSSSGQLLRVQLGGR